MSEIISILKNNVHRMMSRKTYLLASLGLTIAVMALAIYFTSQFEMKGSIAVVGSKESLPASLQNYRVEQLDQIPPKSQLVRNKYDAVLVDDGSGRYTVETIKGGEMKANLQQALVHPDNPIQHETKRGVGANLLGFLTMLIFFEGIIYISFFSEDKLGGTFRRLAVSPAPINRYMAAHCMFCFILIYVPAYVLIAAAGNLLHLDIGFSLFQYAWLLGILALLATAFALFMTAWVENYDNTVMLAGSIIVLTSLLSGNFYTFTPEGIMKWVIEVLPQKQFLVIVQGVEQQASVAEWFGAVIYLFILSGTLLAGGWIICRKRLVEGRY